MLKKVMRVVLAAGFLSLGRCAQLFLGNEIVNDLKVGTRSSSNCAPEFLSIRIDLTWVDAKVEGEKVGFSVWSDLERVKLLYL